MSSRYQEWLKYLFDHEVKERAWYWEDGAPGFHASPAELTNLITETFSSSGKDLVSYTDAQVDQGIWYLASTSELMFALKSSEVPMAARLEAIRSILCLYSDCFAKRCTESLGHLGQEGSELNSACYMFWDICPLTYLEDFPDRMETENTVSWVLEQTLKIPHRACREAALHGICEAFFNDPERMHRIIDPFLKETVLDDKLLAYAQNARAGNVQ
jgi:hypothetical protein